MDGAARARRPWRGGGVAVAVGLVVALAPASPAAPASALTSATTDAGGSFSVAFTPQRNVRVAARVGPDQSAPVLLLVRPKLTVGLKGVTLFGTAVVSGRLGPDHPGASVNVTLLRGDKVAGRGVSALEQRLRDLHYLVPRPNQGFDHRTADAVLAFHKVNGMRRVGSVSRATWKRLANPRTPRPRSKSEKVHIEIDQSKQVLYVVRNGEVDEIVHTSTGAGGATRDGVFSVHRKIAGFSPNRLYYPSYFEGLRAVHGWPDVPPTNASHGCARVPYWTAKHMFSIMGYGMEVRVYH